MNRLIRFFASQGVFADLFSFAVIVVGLYYAVTIKREVFPNVSFDTITVTTIFPGASPKEVEKLITNPLEQDLKEVDGIKRMTSFSAENRSIIILQLDPDQTTEEEARADIKDIVDAFNDLPDGAEDPDVKVAESKQSPVVEVSLAGDIPELELRAVARRMEDELERIKEVAKVVPRGYEDLEFIVEADQKKLARYQLSLDNLIRSISANNVSIPGGTIEADQPGEKEKIVRTVGEFNSIEGIENTVVRANDLGRAIRVKDVANVKLTMKDRSIIFHTNGVPAINLTVLKKESGDAINLVDKVKAKMEALGPQLKREGVTVSFINDASYYIRRRLSILTNNLIVGLGLVLVVLSFILPFRVALIVGFGIPFAFLGTLIVFNVMSISLHMISMIGLIIVLGMLVDDAIVVTENATRRIQEGEDPLEAAVNGTTQIWAPVTASVLTTVVAFFPMASMSGIMGKFVKYIPIAVIAALVISLIECFFILPHHVANWVKPHSDKPRSRSIIQRILASTGKFWDNVVSPTYLRLLRHALRHRYIVAMLTVALMIASVALAAKGMRFILFPPDGVEIFFVRAEAPVGTSLKEMARLIKPIEKQVGDLEERELEDFTTNVGLWAQDINDPNTKRGGNYAQIAVYLTPEPNRDRVAKEIIADLREKVGTPEGISKVTFERVNPGPPVGKPINIGIRGQKYEDILPAVNWIKEKVAPWKGVSDLGDTYVLGKEEIVVVPRAVESAAAGLSQGAIGTTVRAAFEGIISTSVRGLDEEVDVRVTFPKSSRSDSSLLEDLRVLNPAGALIPLGRIADTQIEQGMASYEHEANRRQVSVTGQVDNENITSTEVISRVSAILPEFYQKFPSVTVHFGGEADDTAESMQSLLRAFILAAVGILLILVLNFQRLDQPFLILLTIPLGMVAVIWTFFLHGMPLTFMGMLGIVALAGVIVNNAIVYMDFVNQNRAQGADRWTSVMEAARVRIRPIFLTTVTTVAGILPTAYGIGGLDKFVVPIALALGWGMFFGSILSTFVFPCAVSILDDIVKLLFDPKELKTNP